MLKHCMKALAVLSAVIMTAASLSLDSFRRTDMTVYAKTLKEIELEKKEKQAEIDAKKQELEKLAKDKNSKAAYEQTLEEEIQLISGKMLLIDTQMTNLIGDISAKEQEIADLQVQIEDEQRAVDEGLVLFKKRIRALYVHGNDSLLSALVGATSFYDVLAKIDVIKRISKHDDEMIDKLQADIQSLTNHQQDLTASVQALNIQMTEIGILQDEFQSSRSELDSALADTNVEIEFIKKQQEYAEGELAQQKIALEEIEAEEEEMIQKAIREAIEEEERQKAAEAAKHTTVTTTVTTKATTKATTTTTTTTAAPIETEAPAVVPTPEAPATEAPVIVTEAPVVVTEAPVTQAPPAPTTAATTKATAATTTQAPPTGSMFAWPCPGHYGISSPFGARWGRNHNGIDIIGNVTAINGAAACAAGNGKVIRVCNDGWGGGYGNNVVIYHGNGYSTLYAHLQRTTVSVGQEVSVGQQVGVVGSTGNSTGPHLHFEVRINDSPVNPIPYLP